MDRREMLRKTIPLVKAGDQDAFENFYILTVRMSYGYACSFLGEGKDARRLLTEVYVQLYHKAHLLPVSEKALRVYIYSEMEQLAYSRYGVRAEDYSEAVDLPPLSDERAASIWLAIEQRAGFKEAEPPEEAQGVLPYVFSCLKIALAVAVLSVTVLTLYAGFNWLSESFHQEQAAAALSKETESPSPSKIVMEEPKLKPGWELKPDGKLYYVKRDHTPGNGPIAIGKQLLTFSREGELTLIGENKEVTDHPELSFDEDIKYEVRNGDIYRKVPGEEEKNVVGNGHIVQADIRCGYLWYIAQYQVPNTGQIKTTIYRAGPEGQQDQEIYSTEGPLETGGFQVTDKWFYYTKDRALFRRNLKTDETEFLADDVDYYFAWKDTAFYMKGRTLESVSEGSAYSGVEEGYKLELKDGGFALYNADGSPVEADKNGIKEIGDRSYRLDGSVIKSVRPAPRIAGGVTYSIDQAQNDKISWKNDNGSAGVLNQEGLTVDCLCVTGQWLYYSARTAPDGDELLSQLYRIDLESMEQQKVGESFQGYLKNIYYFDKLQTIFGEYIPSNADSQDLHGRIAVIPVGGEMRLVDDSEVRPQSGGDGGNNGDRNGDNNGGSDMLELLMADSSQIYCYYHHIQNDSTGRFEYKDTKPVIIKYRSGG